MTSSSVTCMTLSSATCMISFPAIFPEDTGGMVRLGEPGTKGTSACCLSRNLSAIKALNFSAVSGFILERRFRPISLRGCDSSGPMACSQFCEGGPSLLFSAGVAAEEEAFSSVVAL